MLYQGKSWRGMIASKHRYFYGLKLHLMVTEAGVPVKFFLTPGSFSNNGSYLSTCLSHPHIVNFLPAGETASAGVYHAGLRS